MNISMKKLALGLLSLFLIVGSINAQEGKKALKKGAKLLDKYGQNAVKNADVLDEGLMLVEKAFEDEDVKTEAKYYNMLGEAYNQVASAQVNAKLVDPTFTITHGKYANKAFDAFKMAHSKAEKDGDRKDAIKGLQALESHLNNIAIYYFQTPDYANAFDYFNTAIEVYKVINANQAESRLDIDTIRMDHYFYTGAAGYYGEKGMEAAPVLEELVAMGTDKGLVYEALYKTFESDDKEKAVGYLEKGREMFPDDTGLLFAEINYYLIEGKLNVLTEKLKSALEKEPDNVTIYTTLGNVFDQLNQKERTAGNLVKADEYFDSAMKYYTEALVKDPTNFDAVYSQGALYYNKAASLTSAINELANDFSAAGTKKYDALKAEMDSYFSQAMPYFLKAEGIDGSDLNTLIALKEIYARSNEMEKVGEYKAKIEALQAEGNK
ncbi:MAG: tetratricopeptide (TPR) repeat protein [Saprospiraceae bacterium]|jgi:tetratricopeptide (TPR) repeat protein